jgi:hypothetical protein
MCLVLRPGGEIAGQLTQPVVSHGEADRVEGDRSEPGDHPYQGGQQNRSPERLHSAAGGASCLAEADPAFQTLRELPPFFHENRLVVGVGFRRRSGDIGRPDDRGLACHLPHV